jgi:glycosyltransferase A (GT-A) superfamily protein (DUF2064 family)
MRRVAPRVLVLFAREPRREALDKGLNVVSGGRLFAAFARGWIDAAGNCGARVVVATPSGDRAAWRRALPGARFETIEQCGDSLGSRLVDAARHAAAASGGGCVVLVGGDVAPSAQSLAAAFELRERAADAVIAPAPDGGVSLVSLTEEDLDLLGRFVPRGADVFSRLTKALLVRRRRTAVVEPAGDVDGRRELGRLLRTATVSAPELEALARAVLAADRWSPGLFASLPATASHVGPQVSRGPPPAA